MSIHALGMTAPITSMLDDQMTMVHMQPLEGTPPAPVPLPAGMSLIWTSDDTTKATVDPTQMIDATGHLVPNTDPLSAVVLGVSGATGDPTITAKTTNPDGLVATGNAPFHITVDPAKLDITDLSVTVDTPVHQ